MLRKLKTTVLLLMAFLLLGNATVSYAVDFHYCSGDFESFALLGTKASCGVDQEKERLTCCDKEDNSTQLVFEKTPCCSNEQFVSDSDLLDQDDPSTVVSEFDSPVLSWFYLRKEALIDVPSLVLVVANPPPWNYPKRSDLQVYII